MVTVIPSAIIRRVKSVLIFLNNASSSAVALRVTGAMGVNVVVEREGEGMGLEGEVWGFVVFGMGGSGGDDGDDGGGFFFSFEASSGSSNW